MSGKKSVYVFGITGFEECYNFRKKRQEPDKIKMKYGMGKDYIFPADKAYDLVLAIFGKKVLVDGMKIEKTVFDMHVKHFGIIKTMQSLLFGKGVVVLTDFENSLEYINGLQNDIVGITGLDFDGSLLCEKGGKMFCFGFGDSRTWDYSPNYDFETIDEEMHEA